MISKENEAEVLRLFHAEKRRIGTIAAQLGLHHTTVQRVLRQTGAELKTVVPRPSMTDPYAPFMIQQLEKYPGLCASRLFEMVRERGYQGGADHFRRGVSRHRPRKPAEAFQRLKTLPRRPRPSRLGLLRQAHRGASRATTLGLRDGPELLTAGVSPLLLGLFHVVFPSTPYCSVPTASAKP